MDKKANLKKSKSVPWMDDMGSAGEVLILESTIIWAILNESCWSTDKNMQNIDSHKCSKKKTRTFTSEQSSSNLISK